MVTTYDLLLRDSDFAEKSSPELVLRFGEMPTSKPLRAWLVDSGAEQIVVDPRARWNEPTRRAATLVRAEPSRLAEVCAARIEKAKREDIGLWLRAEQGARAAIESELNDATALHTEPALHLALGRAHSDGDLVYTASSMPIRDQESFLAAEDADALFLCNRGANGIDGLISSAIGAAHASQRPTTMIIGDLGLLHDIGGLAALGEVSCPVRIVVIDNDGGGIFDFLPQAQALGEKEFESLLGTPRDLDLAKLADLFGLPHHRVETAPQLAAVLGAGTGLIEVKVDRFSNVEHHRRLSAAVAASLSL